MYKILVSQPASASNQSSASTFSLIMATTYQIKSTQESTKRYIEQSCKPNVWFIASLKLVAYTVLQYVTIVVAPLNN